MRRTVTALFVVLLVATACAKRMSIAPLQDNTALLAGEPFIEVRGANYHGTIISDQRVADLTYFFGSWEGFWTPTESDIEALEGGLLDALNTIDCNRYIRENLDSYRRQYVGVVTEGTRRILVNAFPGPEAGDDSKYYWLLPMFRSFSQWSRMAPISVA